MIRKTGRAAFAVVNADNFVAPRGFQSYPELVITPCLLPLMISFGIAASTQSRLKWQDDFTGHGQFPSQVPKPCLSATAISRMTEY